MGLWGSLVSFQLGVLVTPVQIRTDPPLCIFQLNQKEDVEAIFNFFISRFTQVSTQFVLDHSSRFIPLDFIHHLAQVER
jgi:hypothetical protein